MGKLLSFRTRAVRDAMRNWGRWLLSTKTPEQWKAAEERGRQLMAEAERKRLESAPGQSESNQPPRSRSSHHRPGEGDDLS
ncbi:MAG: hypothetical protein DMF84_09120 [Acidobacteria bacterium]|nr:MAG: hypothetical protein DMF84_09120 [Acidobacteriota bacterium]